MLDHRLIEVVAAIRACAPPSGTTTRIVAIDGHGGSGKSSLAQLLSHELDAPIVHTDDFASWENPVDWWPELIDRVLEPLARGQVASYTPTSWGGPERAPIVVAQSDIVLLEGVTSAREAFRPYLAYTIWVETPPDLCLRRGLERDGAEALAQWQQWMAGEARYIARERPQGHADKVLPGDADLWS
jgi:uridine kinase